MRGTDGTGWRAWSDLVARDAAELCVAGVAQTHIYSRFAWQAWHKLTSTIVLRGRRGTDGTGWRAWSDLVARDAAALCVAGVAQTHICHRFAWQAWHKLTSTIVWRGRRGTDGTGLRAWFDLVARDAAALRVAGVAQTHIHIRFAWQAWHELTSTIVWRGRRGTDGTGWRAWSDLVARDAAALCVAGVAQCHIHVRFAWQAWHKLTSTIVLRGRRGTDGSQSSSCIAQLITSSSDDVCCLCRSGIPIQWHSQSSSISSSIFVICTRFVKPSAVKDVVLGLSLAALFVLAQRGKKLPEQRISVVVTLAQRGNSSRSTDKLLLNRSLHHMEHRRSWHTSFSPFQVRSDAAWRADDIAALAKKRCLHCRALTSLSHTPSFTRSFVTHIHIHIYTYTYTYVRTYIRTYVRTYIRTYVHTYIRTYVHTYIRTYIHTYIVSFHIPSCFVTHRLSHATLSHTTVLTSRSFTTSFVFPSFPVPATTFEARYWKKLTCVVIRSFN